MSLEQLVLTGKKVLDGIVSEAKSFDPGNEYALQERITYGVYSWIEDSTAIIIPSVPIWAGVEIGSAFASQSETPTSTFVKARLIGIGFGYLGLGLIYTAGRRVSLNLSDISETAEEDKTKRRAHDALFTAGYTILTCVPIYQSAGMSWTDTLLATGVASVVHTPLGPFYGKVATGIKGNSRWVRDKILSKKTRAKITELSMPLVSALVSAEITAGVYLLHNHFQ